MLLKEITTELFADYFQFYLRDEIVSDESSNPWTNEAVERLLALNNGTIIVGTVRDMDVLTIVKVFDQEPEILKELISIHQINECDLEMNSDKLVLAGCTDYFPEALRINIGKGIFRARIYYKDLDKLSEDGLDGEDSYEIHLWPTKRKSGIQILKNRNASA